MLFEPGGRGKASPDLLKHRTVYSELSVTFSEKRYSALEAEKAGIPMIYEGMLKNNIFSIHTILKSVDFTKVSVEGFYVVVTP